MSVVPAVVRLVGLLPGGLLVGVRAYFLSLLGWQLVPVVLGCCSSYLLDLAVGLQGSCLARRFDCLSPAELLVRYCFGVAADCRLACQ